MSETLIGKAFTNSFSFPGGFVVQADKPIDDRFVVHSVASLTAANTFVSSTDNLLKAYNGMVVSVLETNEIYILKDVANITKINSWEKVNVPHASLTDEGKILTVEKVNVGTTEKPIYKYEGRWVDVPSELPSMGVNETGKLLTVVKVAINPTGSGETTYKYEAQWVEAPSGLPTINGTSDANKILQVDATGTGVKWVTNTHPKELPTYTGADGGKVLTVSSNGRSTEWSTVDTELVKNISTQGLHILATQGSLKPGMKYRIMDYAPAVNTSYSVGINGELYSIISSGIDDPPYVVTPVKFDIIVTASSQRTLFEDVELVAKDVPHEFDYTKYEAKYDLFGNTTGPKYGYIAPNGLGVIYYMKDQFGNEASYDFENIFYISPSTFPGPIHTFTGFKVGDLRQYGVIQNVRIKNSRETLPGIIFEFGSYHVNSDVIINDVELNNCSDIYISFTNLRHAKISNSNHVSIHILYADNFEFYTMLENLNICNNFGLTITGNYEIISPMFAPVGGFYVNNLNILPSLLPRAIDLVEMAPQMVRIVKQGLIDADVQNKMNLSPENSNGAWLFALLNMPDLPESMSPPSFVLFGPPEFVFNNVISDHNDVIVYDAIINASKNIKPFDIFNAVDDSGNIIPWTLEIPHFKSTANSVVEVAI